MLYYELIGKTVKQYVLSTNMQISHMTDSVMQNYENGSS